MKNFLTSFRLGRYLAIRQLRNSNIGTTALIILVMMLTFLNLIVIKGLLVGLVESSTYINKDRYYGGVVISTLSNKTYIENSSNLVEAISNMPGVEAYSARYVQPGTITGTYKDRMNYTDKPNQSATYIVGINPENENETTDMAKWIVNGSYLEEDDYDYILLGANLLKKYLPNEAPGISTLDNVDVGSKVLLTVGNNTREVEVKGVIVSKVDVPDQRVFILESTLRQMAGRSDYNVAEIAVKLEPNVNSTTIRNNLISLGFSKNAKVQTFEESLPKFILDLRGTFNLLGDIVGSIGLVVAFVAIFIVVYINAITRRKFIGILKAIGIDSTAIEISYVIQSIVYGVTGSTLSIAFLYLFLIPYLNANPINFPFSDVSLVITFAGTVFRASWFLIVTILAGYIPARIVVKQNTLDAILGK